MALAAYVSAAPFMETKLRLRPRPSHRQSALSCYLALDLALEDVAQRPAAHLQQREQPASQRRRLVGVAAVEQPRRGAHRLAQRVVVGMPPEVARTRGLPGDELDVHALPEAELRM